MSKRTLYVVSGIVFAAAMSYFGLLIAEARSAAGGNLWHAAALGGSILVTIGWIVTSANTIRNSQLQQTISVILSRTGNGDVERHWGTIHKYLPNDTAILEPGTNNIPPYSERQSDLYRSVEYILDDYDFIALGVNSGIFDGWMIDNAMGYKFAFFYKQTRKYIEHHREIVGNDLWIEYTSVCERWSKCPPGHYHLLGWCLTRKCNGA